MTEKKWVLEENPDTEAINSLSKAINVNPVLSGVLVQRGVADYDSAKAFFRPSLDHLYDPFLMQDMDKAVNRIQGAMKRQEKILIYGDYDVDGTTAVTLLFHYLFQQYPLVEYYIPDRYQEGYGLSTKGVQYAVDNNFSLVVTLDCGIKAGELIDQANQDGLDFIVGDHHLPDKVLPPAVAVLDPKRPDCAYPYKDLSGCGIAFKLVQALESRQDQPDQAVLSSYLDLVAVSIASDIVPITGENRILAYYGLKRLNDAPRPGLRVLAGKAFLEKNIDINGIVFGIGPRINAAGRISHAYSAVELLLAASVEIADEMVERVNELNMQRRDYDDTITQEALQMIEADPLSERSRTTVLYKDDWHKGIIGIVASRCIEHYYRPTIILTRQDDVVTGSARSVEGFNLYEALLDCGEFLEKFGGHQYAAGLSMNIQNVDKFKKRFEEVVSSRILQEQLIPRIHIDHKIRIDQMTARFYNILKQFGPFGPANMDPVFMAEDLVLTTEPVVMKEKHLKIRVRQDNSSYTMEAVGFGFGHLAPELKNKNFKMAFCVGINHYNGCKNLQLSIKDIKFE